MKVTRFLAGTVGLCMLACGFGFNLSAQDIFSIVPAISTNLVGDTVRLLTLQNGAPADPALEYHWSLNGTNLLDSDRITGAQLRELMIANADLGDSGVYTVAVSSNGVLTATASATVYVIAAPEILSVTSETVGADVTFRVEATGGLLSYQWLWQGEEIAGATGSTLRFSNAYAVANAGYYSVRVTNLLGASFSSPTSLLFTKPAPSGTYQGIYLIDGGLTPDSCGYFQFTISGSKRSFSGKFISGASVVRSAGTFSLAHVADVALPGPGGSTVPVRLQLLTTNDTPQIVGFSTNDATQVFLLGNRLYYNSKLTNSLAGRYTLSLQNTNLSPLAPNGDGYATLKISPGGRVTLSGQAADGSRFSQSCGLSRLGDWPLYASLNQGRGRLVGILRVAKQANSSIGGTGIVWVKGPGSDTLYPDGFYLTLEGVGSSYVPPLRQPVLAWTNGVVAFHGGDLFADGAVLWDFVQVVLRPPASFVPEEGTEDLKLSAGKSTGTITGQFRDIVTGLKASIKGVVLQQQKTARGFFISTNAAGSFSMDGR